MAEVRPTNFCNIKVGLATGGNAATDLTLTVKDGTLIGTKDQIIFCGHFSTAAAIATLADLTDECSCVTAGSVQCASTATTSDQLLVIFNHVND